jgi:hypothetical protein
MMYWRRGFGLRALLIAMVAMWPYLASAYHSRGLVTADRLRVAVFLAVVVIGALLMGAFYIGAVGNNFGLFAAIGFTTFQAAAYVLIASALFPLR